VTANADPRISVCIVCRDEAELLQGCLETLSWADELVVVDLESSDGSAHIAESFGATVVRRPPVPRAIYARNDADAAASGDWILHLDPDERVTPKLAAELRRIATTLDFDVVELPFLHIDFGRIPSDPHRRYDPKVRFYRRGTARWTAHSALPIVEGRVFTLPRDDERVIVHERDRDVVGLLDRVGRVAPDEAQGMLARGEEFSARAMVIFLGQKFQKYFIHGRALDDGVPGLIRAGAKLAHHFYVWAALWELSGRPSTLGDDRFLRHVGAGARLSWRLAWPVRRLFKRARRTNGAST
jgi:glycosyltransferase involved in cell wall biosynthesis